MQITDANKTRFYVLSAKEPQGEAFPRAVFVATCKASRIDDIIVEGKNDLWGSLSPARPDAYRKAICEYMYMNYK